MNPYRLALLAMPTPDKNAGHLPGICRAFEMPVRPTRQSMVTWQYITKTRNLCGVRKFASFVSFHFISPNSFQAPPV
jgi:hypothetical protein